MMFRIYLATAIPDGRCIGVRKGFISWSGGKDCCLAAWQARMQGIEIVYLLNMVTEDGRRSCSHGIAAQWIRQQAEALGIPLLQFPTTGDNYQDVFTGALKKLHLDGVSTGVFGDIDFAPHREWIENVCKLSGVTPVLPLWGGNQNKIVLDFIENGFQAVVIAVRADLLGEGWLGRVVDTKFLNDIAGLHKNITPCGEAGEFHTLVIDGPIFKKHMAILDAAPEKRGEYWFWDIKKIELTDKTTGGAA
jgi:diphthine-ammonia ligase